MAAANGFGLSTYSTDKEFLQRVRSGRYRVSASHEMKVLWELTQELVKHPLSRVFSGPMSPGNEGDEDGNDVIRRPMDLRTVRDKLARKEYGSTKEWEADVNRVFENCIKCNGKDSVQSVVAEYMQKYFRKRLKRVYNMDYRGWIQSASAAYWRLSDLLANGPQCMKEGAKATKRDQFRPMTPQGYDKLTAALSSLKDESDIRPVIQILTTFGVDMPVRSKKGSVNLKSLPPAGLWALKELVSEMHH
jgi:hypothetical protein